MTADSNRYYDLNDDENWKFPLLLSCLAGGSTCLGAAVVFIWDAKQIESSMSFSLSLAASVMITVSVISIGPECMEGIIEYDTKGQEYVIDGYLLMQRTLSFGVGCFCYWLLSKLLELFPEPDKLLFSTRTSSSSTTTTLPLQQQQQQKQVESENTIRRRPSSTPSPPPPPPPVEEEELLEQQEQEPFLIEPASPSRITLRRGTSLSSTEEGGGKDDHEEEDAIAYDDDKEDDKGGLDDHNDDSNMKHKKKSIIPSLEERRKSSWRVAMLLFFSLLFHNFPEGLAVVVSTVESHQLGITVAIGILVHNIPEGIAIAVPCIAAKPNSKWLAFWLASSSGLAEPLGAIVAIKLLKRGSLITSLENILAFVAGIMCMVAVLELYPEARKHNNTNHHRTSVLGAGGGGGGIWYYLFTSSPMTIGSICGMTIMIVTEWYLVP